MIRSVCRGLYSSIRQFPFVLIHSTAAE